MTLVRQTPHALKAISSQWIYLCSSNQRRLYNLDSLSALTLPEGWILHYRYRRNLIGQKLANVIPQSADLTDQRQLLRDQQINIVMTSVFQTSNPTDVKGSTFNIHSLIPLRHAILADAYFDGDIAHFFCRLEAHIKTDDIKFNDKDMKNLFRRLVVDGIPDMGIYAAFGEPFPQDLRRGADVTSFQSTVNVLQERSMSDATTLFALFHGPRAIPKREFKLQGKSLRDLTSSRLTPSFDALPQIIPHLTSYDVPDSQYLIFAITTYQKELPVGFSNLALKINFDPTYFDLLSRPTVPLLSPYDRFDFVLAARPQPTDQWSSLSFEVTGEDETQAIEDLLAVHWVIPIRIMANIRRINTARVINIAADIVVAIGIIAIGAAGLEPPPLFDPQTWGVVGIVFGLLGLLGIILKQLPYFKLG